MVGILLAWPVSSLIGGAFGWRTLYAAHATAIAASIVAMALVLPARRPERTLGYPALLATLGQLFRETPGLRRRFLAQAFLFGSFSLFWTAVPLQLARHGFTSTQMALFGLVGGAGTLVAPLAGRAADRGLGRDVALAGGIACGVAFAVGAVSYDVRTLSIGAVLLGAGVQANLVVAQRDILSMHVDAGHRLNAMFVATFFAGGAMGSCVASPLMTLGWGEVALVGLACSAGALALLLVDAAPRAIGGTRRPRSRTRA